MSRVCSSICFVDPPLILSMPTGRRRRLAFYPPPPQPILVPRFLSAHGYSALLHFRSRFFFFHALLLAGGEHQRRPAVLRRQRALRTGAGVQLRGGFGVAVPPDRSCFFPHEHGLAPWLE